MISANDRWTSRPPYKDTYLFESAVSLCLFVPQSPKLSRVVITPHRACLSSILLLDLTPPVLPQYDPQVIQNATIQLAQAYSHLCASNTSPGPTDSRVLLLYRWVGGPWFHCVQWHSERFSLLRRFRGVFNKWTGKAITSLSVWDGVILTFY